MMDDEDLSRVPQAGTETSVRTKRRYTLPEDRIVERWYETRHVPWMLKHPCRYWETPIIAGRVLNRLKPGRSIDEVAREELSHLLDTAGDERAQLAANLPQRRTTPDWLADIERLAALSGETGGASLATIARLAGWRPDQTDASPAARAMLHRALYQELEPLLRQAMRDERVRRESRPRRKRSRQKPAPDAPA